MTTSFKEFRSTEKLTALLEEQQVSLDIPESEWVAQPTADFVAELKKKIANQTEGKDSATD